MELVYDGEINVKCAGIRLIFKIIDALSPEARATRITNLFIELLGSINEEVLKVISSQIGQIIAKVNKIHYIIYFENAINYVIKFSWNLS